jgi:oxygen-independent coproporphyrinogen-3 oxidase
VDLATKVLPAARTQVSTVFFGGGTPTLLAPERLGGIIRRIDDAFGLAKDAEVTVEANPETVGPAALEQLRAQGVTRISFGMQSAVPHVLRVLDREHQPGRPLDCVRWAREAGLGADDLEGLPVDLRAVADVVDHASTSSASSAVATTSARSPRRTTTRWPTAT